MGRLIAAFVLVLVLSFALVAALNTANFPMTFGEASDPRPSLVVALLAFLGLIIIPFLPNRRKP